jgi:hypothetical protein
VLVVGEPFLADSEAGEIRPVAGAQRVVHSKGDRVFEIAWESYVAYSVVNESARTWDDDTTRRRHWHINCENHVVDVISTEEPLISARLTIA